MIKIPRKNTTAYSVIEMLYSSDAVEDKITRAISDRSNVLVLKTIDHLVSVGLLEIYHPDSETTMFKLSRIARVTIDRANSEITKAGEVETRIATQRVIPPFKPLSRKIPSALGTREGSNDHLDIKSKYDL